MVACVLTVQFLHIISRCRSYFPIVEVDQVRIPLRPPVFCQQRSIRTHVHYISIPFQSSQIKCFGQSCFHIRSASGDVSGIFAQIYFRFFRAVVLVIEVLIVQEPSRRLIIMFVYHRNTEFVRQFPAFHIVCSLIERTYCADNDYLRIFLFDSKVYHREAFFEDIGDQVFIADADIFQIERLRMTGFGTYLAPFGFLCITVRPFYQVEDILNVSTHLAHRDTALLTASQIAMTGGILTRYTCRQHRKRFRTYIFAELEVFIITQSHALMISPKVTGRFTGFQRSDSIFPLIDVLQTVSMSHAASGETDKARVHIGKCLGKVGTQTVLSAFECILREERNHIQFDFTCRLRTKFQTGIGGRFCCQHCFIRFPRTGRDGNCRFTLYGAVSIYEVYE